MEHPCAHCDHPDSSLLRVVLIGEIVRADEATLFEIAEVFQALGLLDLCEEEESLPAEVIQKSKRVLQLVR